MFEGIDPYTVHMRDAGGDDLGNDEPNQESKWAFCPLDQFDQGWVAVAVAPGCPLQECEP
jgi:hypothetical protein